MNTMATARVNSAKMMLAVFMVPHLADRPFQDEQGHVNTFDRGFKLWPRLTQVSDKLVGTVLERGLRLRATLGVDWLLPYRHSFSVLGVEVLGPRAVHLGGRGAKSSTAPATRTGASSHVF